MSGSRIEYGCMGDRSTWEKGLDGKPDWVMRALEWGNSKRLQEGNSLGISEEHKGKIKWGWNTMINKESKA